MKLKLLKVEEDLEVLEEDMIEEDNVLNYYKKNLKMK